MICRFFYVFIIWFLSFESATGSQYGVGYNIHTNTMNRSPSYHMLVSVVLTQCAVVQIIKFKMLMKMSLLPPENPDVSLHPVGLANRRTAKDLGTFWSRRKKARANQANLPFSSFWSRRKKSRPSLPSLPFSTIIRYLVSIASCPAQSSPHPDLIRAREQFTGAREAPRSELQ